MLDLQDSCYPPASPLRIAVNVAPRDLERKGFVDEVIAAVKSLPPHVSLVLRLGHWPLVQIALCVRHSRCQQAIVL